MMMYLFGLDLDRRYWKVGCFQHISKHGMKPRVEERTLCRDEITSDGKDGWAAFARTFSDERGIITMDMGRAGWSIIMIKPLYTLNHLCDTMNDTG